MTEPLVSALQNSHTRLRGLVEPLGPEGIRAPAYPTEWSIAQVVSHLGTSAVIFGLHVEAGLHGADMAGSEQFKPIWDAWNAKTPDQQAADGLAADTQLVERLASLTDAERAAWGLVMYSGLTDISGLLRLRLTEHAVHTWDVAAAFDAAALVAADAVPLVIDHLAPLVRWVAQPHEPARIRVLTTDPARVFLLDLGATNDLRAWDDGPQDGELRLPAEAFIRLLYGRTAVDHPVRIEPITIEADGIDLDDLRSTFPRV